MLLKVTALKYITILDPIPLEGVGKVTIQQSPGEYKEYDILPVQVTRLIPLLDRAVTAGMLTYTTEFPFGVSLSVKNSGVVVEPDCRILNVLGPGAEAIAMGGNEVDIYHFHPTPTYSPPLGTSVGALVWPTTTSGYVSRPEGGPGTPYFDGGWGDQTNDHPRINTTDLAVFSTSGGGLGITHASARVTDLQLGQIDVVLTDGNGNTETVSLVLNPVGGDQDATSVGGNLAIHVRNTVPIGDVIEGTVYIYADPSTMLGIASTGTGGYFKLEVNHTAAPVPADFGDVFWDDGVIPNSSVDPVVAANTPVVGWLSGIRYFYTGSTFNVTDNSSPPSGVADVVNMTMNNDGAIFNIDSSEFNETIGDVLYNDASISGLSYLLSLSPFRDDRPVYNKLLTVGAGPFGNLDAQVHTTWKNFHGDEAGSPKNSLVGVYQIWAKSTSTDSTDYYDDEDYRLQDESVNNFKQVLADNRRWWGGGVGADLRNWDSQQDIISGSVGHIPGLQCYGGYLVYPSIDFSTGFYFADSDYSAATGDRDIYRAFNVGDLLNHKAFTLTLQVTGFVEADFDIGAGGDDSTDARIDVLFPGPERPTPIGSNDATYPGSGWLHCGKAFNAPLFTGIDNDGVLLGTDLSGGVLTLYIVTGNMSSYYTQGTVIVRLRFKSGVGTDKIGQLTVVGT